MPQIIVTTDRGREHEQSAVMLRERVSASDLESGHFQAQLVERIGWAVGDAQQVEREVHPADRAARLDESTADSEPQPIWAT